MRPSILPRSLIQDANGLWRTPSQSAVSFPPDGHAPYLAVEDGSYWFGHRNRCIVSAMNRLPPGGTILDVGGGTGFVAHGLAAAGFDTIVLEADPGGAQAARRRGLDTVILGTLQDVDFAPDTVPAAAMFDVLEHIEDDLDALGRIHSILAPGGRLYLTVPAFQLLFSSEDRLVGHFRRYSITSLAAVLGRAKFTVEFASYLFALLPLPIFLTRTVPSRLFPAHDRTLDQSADAHRAGGLGRRILDRSLDWEAARIARGGVLHFGSSCLVVARK